MPKTAGSSVRFALRAAEAKGWCRYWGYSISDASWLSALSAISQYASSDTRPPDETWSEQRRGDRSTPAELALSDGAPVGRRQGLGLCVELHGRAAADPAGGSGRGAEDMLRSHIAPLHRLRAQLAGRCTIVSAVRVREPLSWYRSMYAWAVAGLPFEVSRPCADSQRCTPTELFERFVALAPNMQATMFVRGIPPAAWAECARAHECRWTDRRAALSLGLHSHAPRPLSERELETALGALGSFDVVDVTSRFDRFMAQLAIRAGWPAGQHPYLRYAPPSHAQLVRAGCNGLARSAGRAPTARLQARCRLVARFRANATSAPPCGTVAELRRCAAAVATHAPMDVRLFERAVSRAAELAAELGPRLDERERALRESSAAPVAAGELAGGAWSGGKPSQPLCAPTVLPGYAHLGVRRARAQSMGIGGLVPNWPCAPVSDALSDLIYAERRERAAGAQPGDQRAPSGLRAAAAGDGRLRRGQDGPPRQELRACDLRLPPRPDSVAAGAAIDSL